MAYRLAAALTLLACFPAVAATPPAPFDSAAVDAVFADLTVEDSPGCALAVVSAGEVLYAKGYGLAQIENGVPIKPDTVFDIGSTSKQFTAALILLLVQDGKLALDDDIRKFVPEMPDYGSKVTVRHLLHHTSGLRDYINLMTLGGFEIPDHTTAEDALGILARQKALDFPPGSEHSYSNSGYFLLSVIAERVSGKPLRQLGQEKIFGPLGMKDTQILDNHTRVIARKATSYEPDEGPGFMLSTSAWEQTGDGAVQTTVLDLAKWDANFYEPRVGGAELVAALQETGRLTDGSAIDYARGLTVGTHRGLPVVSHGGAWMGFRAEMMRFPTERRTVITLCNLGSANPTARSFQVAEVLLASRLAPPPPAPVESAAKAADVPAGDVHRFEGLWWAEGSSLVRRTLIRDGKLIYQRSPGNETELVVTAPGQFAMVGTPEPTTVTQEGQPGARRLVVATAGGRPTRFVEVAPPAEGAETEAGLLGRYSSAELDATMTVTNSAPRLALRPRRGEPLWLVPAFRDAFSSLGSVLIRLRRDSKGQIDGFWLDMGRARNIEFVKLPP